MIDAGCVLNEMQQETILKEVTTEDVKFVLLTINSIRLNESLEREGPASLYKSIVYCSFDLVRNICWSYGKRTNKC